MSIKAAENLVQKSVKEIKEIIAICYLTDLSFILTLILSEMILKLRGEWNFPYADEELCHCRSIATQTVDQAIIAGAHSPEVVTRQTSASTACGTCRPTVQKIIEYRTRKTA